jgi:hypothetical protein
MGKKLYVFYTLCRHFDMVTIKCQQNLGLEVINLVAATASAGVAGAVVLFEPGNIWSWIYFGELFSRPAGRAAYQHN